MRSSTKKGLNVGWLIERTRYCIRERAFAEKWIAENKRHQNYGKHSDDLIQKLFNRSSEIFPTQRAKLRVTARERFIVATVIQWLGTNIGFAWLTEVLDLIGYKIVPKDEERKRYYYHPFKDERDASAWNNIASKSVVGRLEKLPPHVVRSVPIRRHFLVGYSGEYGQICIRCGFKPHPYDKRCEPECFANFQTTLVRKRKTKPLPIYAPQRNG